MAPLIPTDTDTDGGCASYTFTALDKAFPSLQVQTAKDSLRKWNLLPFQQAAAFRFDQPFSPDAIDAFLLDFFASPVVQGRAPVSTGVPPSTEYVNNNWGALGTVLPGSIKYSRLASTVLRLDFFDRLRDHEIVRSGDIAKCLDTQVGEVLVSDRLRKLLLDEASEEWELFTESERSELIFRIMKALVVGGGMNQYDDQIEPYLNLTKAVYKDLVSVHKTAAGTLQVGSLTFAVTDVAGSSCSLFPRPSEHNFCYVTIDPVARHVKLWYSAWFPMM